MDCTEFRARIEADPAAADPAAAAHEQICTACAAYAVRLRRAEHLIGQALRFDVAAVRQYRGSAPRTARPTYGRAAAAAAVVAAIAVWAGLRWLPSDDPEKLAETIEDHWQHEPESWVRTEVPVAAPVLDAALDGSARVDRDRLRIVSYARSCLINGRWVPHLVVQGDTGPVMVLLMPREPVEHELPLDLPAQGLRGAVYPLQQGSVAILGGDDESIESLRQEVAAAVEWTI
jgi:hypothetical protein